MTVCYRGRRLAKKYYDKLFKEYCIADLSRYKENKVFDISCYFLKTNLACIADIKTVDFLYIEI